MSKVGDKERIAQNRVVKLFQDELKYRYLGNLEKEENNSNVDEALLTIFLMFFATNRQMHKLIPQEQFSVVATNQTHVRLEELYSYYDFLQREIVTYK